MDRCLEQRDPRLEAGFRDVRARDRERRLPWVEADDRRLRERRAERNRKAGDSRADVEDACARRSDAYLRHEVRDHGGSRALRLQKDGVGVAPSRYPCRIVDEIQGLPQVRAGERDDDRALALVERVVQLP